MSSPTSLASGDGRNILRGARGRFTRLTLCSQSPKVKPTRGATQGESPRIRGCSHDARLVIPVVQNPLIIITNRGGCSRWARARGFTHVLKKCISITCEVGTDTKLVLSLKTTSEMRRTHPSTSCFSPQTITSFSTAHWFPGYNFMNSKEHGTKEARCLPRWTRLVCWGPSLCHAEPNLLACGMQVRGTKPLVLIPELTTLRSSGD